MTEDLLSKAKETQSPEELLTLLQENGMEDFTQENAEELYSQLHTSGELTDEELENVTGGKVTVGGQKYRVVTNHQRCFTGQYVYGYSALSKGLSKGEPLRDDRFDLRVLWGDTVGKNQCGSCLHLGFTKALTGYCEIEHDV